MAVLLIGACGSGKQNPVPENKERPDAWATKVAAKGLPNLHRISADLYRGAQPTVEGFKTLHEMGIKTIVNFRKHHSDRDEITAAGLDGAFNIVEIPTKTHALGDETITRFLAVVADPANRPLFFHCMHGADRTGTAAAAYRVVVEGWSKTDAIQEMVNGGYGYHAVWRHLPKYLESLDVPKMKRVVGDAQRRHAPAEKTVNLSSATDPDEKR